MQILNERLLYIKINQFLIKFAGSSDQYILTASLLLPYLKRATQGEEIVCIK
jgi:hypothetical protein